METGELPITPPIKPVTGTSTPAPAAPIRGGINLAGLGRTEQPEDTEQNPKTPTPQESSVDPLAVETAEEIREAVGEPAEAAASDSELAEFAGSGKTGAEIQSAVGKIGGVADALPQDTEGASETPQEAGTSNAINSSSPLTGNTPLVPVLTEHMVQEAVGASREGATPPRALQIDGELPVDSASNSGLASAEPAVPEVTLPAPEPAPAPSLEEETDEASLQLTPPPPEQGESGEKGKENGEIEPAPAEDASETHPTTPDTPRDVNEVKSEVEGKIDDLAQKVQEVLDDPNGDPAFKEAYRQIHDQLVTDELQKTASEMSQGLTDRIDKARENEQLTVAHVLEERQQRIAEMTEQAHKQASLELLNHPQFGSELQKELSVVNGATPEIVRDVVEQVHAESDVRREMSGEELKAEKGRVGALDNLAAEADKAKKDKKSGTANLHLDELDVVKRGLRADALQAVMRGTESDDPDIRKRAEARIQRLLNLSKRADTPLARNPLLRSAEVASQKSDADKITALRQLAKREAVLADEENKLMRVKGRLSHKNKLDRIASQIDQASGLNQYSNDKDTVKFADAQDVFERQYAKELATMREAAAIKADQHFEQQERDATLSTIAKADIPKIREKLTGIRGEQKQVKEVSEDEEKDAKKQINQKFGSYARRLKHSWQEWRKENTPETRRELWLSAKEIAKEGLKTALKWWLIWQLVMILTITAVEMRLAGKMFGQDGK